MKRFRVTRASTLNTTSSIFITVVALTLLVRDREFFVPGWLTIHLLDISLRDNTGEGGERSMQLLLLRNTSVLGSKIVNILGTVEYAGIVKLSRVIDSLCILPSPFPSRFWYIQVLRFVSRKKRNC